MRVKFDEKYRTRRMFRTNYNDNGRSIATVHDYWYSRHFFSRLAYRPESLFTNIKCEKYRQIFECVLTRRIATENEPGRRDGRARACVGLRRGLYIHTHTCEISTIFFIINYKFLFYTHTHTFTQEIDVQNRNIARCEKKNLFEIFRTQVKIILYKS